MGDETTTNETGETGETEKRKNKPRHHSAMEAAYERELSKLEGAIANFAPVWRGYQASVKRSTALGDDDVRAAVNGIVASVLAEPQADASSAPDQA